MLRISSKAHSISLSFQGLSLWGFMWSDYRVISKSLFSPTELEELRSVLEGDYPCHSTAAVRPYLRKFIQCCLSMGKFHYKYSRYIKLDVESPSTGLPVGVAMSTTAHGDILVERSTKIGHIFDCTPTMNLRLWSRRATQVMIAGDVWTRSVNRFYICSRARAH